MLDENRISDIYLDLESGRGLKGSPAYQRRRSFAYIRIPLFLRARLSLSRTNNFPLFPLARSLAQRTRTSKFRRARIDIIMRMPYAAENLFTLVRCLAFPRHSSRGSPPLIILIA